MFPETVSIGPSRVREISTTELAALLQGDARPQLAEILGPQSFASGHLPHAINLPLEGFGEAALRTLPDKTAEIVVYCASSTCKNSDTAAQRLVSLGYTNVRLFREGKAGWQAAGYSLVA